MGRIVHIALKVGDMESFEKSTEFYEDVFGIYQTKTGHYRGHLSRHMTDGNIDLAIMLYDSEDEKEAKLAGAGPRIHHIGVEVEDRPSMIAKIEANGGKIFSDRAEGALKYFAPDGTLGEIVGIGRYPKKDKSKKSKIAHVAMKVNDLELSKKFYENVFGFKVGKVVDKGNGHISMHMTDGETDITLMKYESEQAMEAALTGDGNSIHHWGMEVADRDALIADLKAKGIEVLSKPDADAIKFRGPDGNIAEVMGADAYASYRA
jgi:lactoylglutathione lyase